MPGPTVRPAACAGGRDESCKRGMGYFFRRESSLRALVESPSVSRRGLFCFVKNYRSLSSEAPVRHRGAEEAGGRGMQPGRPGVFGRIGCGGRGVQGAAPDPGPPGTPGQRCCPVQRSGELSTHRGATPVRPLGNCVCAACHGGSTERSCGGRPFETGADPVHRGFPVDGSERAGLWRTLESIRVPVSWRPWRLRFRRAGRCQRDRAQEAQP